MIHRFWILLLLFILSFPILFAQETITADTITPAIEATTINDINELTFDFIPKTHNHLLICIVNLIPV